MAGISERAVANRFLKTEIWPRFNLWCTVPALEQGSAFVPLLGIDLMEILCLHESRTVRADNSFTYRGMTLQIPAQQHRCHFVKVKVTVHEYPDQSLAIFQGPRCLARFTADGVVVSNVCDPEPVPQQK